jgi:hypothetical protein
VAISLAQRRFVLLEHGVGAALFNLVLNALIAWGMFRGASVVPLWGEQSIAGDTLGTGFLLPFLTTLIDSAIVRRDVRRGRVPPLAERPALVAALPARMLARALVLGVAGIVVLGVPAILALQGLGVTELPLRSFVAMKATIAAVMAAIVTPVVALVALADPVD